MKERRLANLKSILRITWSNLAFLFLSSFCLILVFLPFIANDVPLWVHTSDKNFSPVLSPSSTTAIVKEAEQKEIILLDHYDWEAFQEGVIVWPLIPYSEAFNNSRIPKAYPPLHKSASLSAYPKPPTFSKHWLGTFPGMDTLAAILYSSRTSLGIAVGAGFLALLWASLAGGISVYYRNKPLSLSYWDYCWIIIGVLAIYFWVLYSRQHIPGSLKEVSIKLFILSLIGGIWWQGRVAFRKIPLSFFQAGFSLSPDYLILKLIELLNSFPALMLIVGFSIFFGNSIWEMVLILSFLAWTGMARIIRTEALKYSRSGFIQAAKGLGMPSVTIFFRHYLPNLLSPLIIPFTSSLKALLLIESALSYLGIGLSPKVPSLGRLIKDGINDISSWWNILFPALTLCFIILSLHIIGEKTRDRYDPLMNKKSQEFLGKL